MGQMPIEITFRLTHNFIKCNHFFFQIWETNCGEQIMHRLLYVHNSALSKGKKYNWSKWEILVALCVEPLSKKELNFPSTATVVEFFL